MEEHEREILDAECVAEALGEVERAIEALVHFLGIEISRQSGGCSREACEMAGRYVAARRLRRLAVMMEPHMVASDMGRADPEDGYELGN